MRELQLEDLFKFTRILRKLDIKKEIQSLDFQNVENDSTGIGIQVFWLLLENSDKAEKEVYEFLASVAGVTPQEMKTMSLSQLGELIQEFQKIPGLANFFRSAFKQVTKN
ncbi:hypothetical protein J2Z48_002108 [Croceifilum oryzae]|uniref:Uncharacterized protein n=1 Tax=Croceifilum oryzae TaxID=1553429 RepID=A0AAJ1TG79_9BACL|nr:hypothetical protein [Croceifilum oryzae]MDQ0417924.1 hypothetical protein [Croceifilum oryzae]